ncbi:mannitol-1-phosphate 5-dehydrogenase [Alkalibacterium olivapovliticus]|uniref:Mannitol-1-phosphate 5-dehydrogenase n=1 Tax=Alkalibacterium olivapovliticus TaxID=99907 RepID=A0A2T0WAA9_9LACT|nr:mannitol-1-phosphate 5-dehydrogenase [Alkalibacterium olivapovliticus]PRY83640.1 mannitol-1-phosphate 5-dehydrogenase [Alkalibacterium olivapovliticus]
MLTVHFGAGNIGRGFIGEVLNKNESKVAFVDVNSAIIDALNDRKEYTIEEAAEQEIEVKVDNVYGINNQVDPEKVVDAIVDADLVTTAIGPKILPFIAPLIAQGIEKRNELGLTTSIDVIACENMIGGSSFLKEEVLKHLKESDSAAYLEEFIGFPDAAVDRIVPMQTHDDILRVTVEPYKEWVISKDGLKNTDLVLKGIHYVDDLEPYIERKLFTVNTGHATTAYNGAYAGYKTIDEALKDEVVYTEVKSVLEETGALLISKWGFDKDVHSEYISKIISRFENVKLSDDITRVGRTPIRKLGYDERFIRPIREADERGLKIDSLVSTVGKALAYDDINDEESVELRLRLKEESADKVIKDITKLTDEKLLKKITEAYNTFK